MKPIFVERQKPVGKIHGRGRKKGNGDNMRLLARLVDGDSLWDVPRDKKDSIRTSARRAGIKVRVRAIPNTDLYAIERLPWEEQPKDLDIKPLP